MLGAWWLSARTPSKKLRFFTVFEGIGKACYLDPIADVSKMALQDQLPALKSGNAGSWILKPRDRFGGKIHPANFFPHQGLRSVPARLSAFGGVSAAKWMRDRRSAEVRSRGSARGEVLRSHT
jgi:hypothetical protein